MQLSIEQQRLVEDNLALVHKVIKDKVRGVGVGIYTYEDLFQFGCVGLCKAAYTDKFQYAYNRENTHSESEMRFSTYAYRLIWNEICTQLEYSTKVSAESAVDPETLFLYGAKTQGFDGDDTEHADARISLERILAKAEKNASTTVAKGIRALRYVVAGYTSAEIARMMGVGSCQNITACISKARKYLTADAEFIKLLRTA